MVIIVSMSLILHAVERLGIDLDSEESEYDAYVFYQVNVVMMRIMIIIMSCYFIILRPPPSC